MSLWVCLWPHLYGPSSKFCLTDSLGICLQTEPRVALPGNNFGFCSHIHPHFLLNPWEFLFCFFFFPVWIDSNFFLLFVSLPSMSLEPLSILWKNRVRNIKNDSLVPNLPQCWTEKKKKFKHKDHSTWVREKEKKILVQIQGWKNTD